MSPDPRAGSAGSGGAGKAHGDDRDHGPGSTASVESVEETEPDARFTFANERTFLAWSRTALALIVAGLAIVQLLPPFPRVPGGRRLLAIPLIVLGAILSVAGYLEWERNQRALRCRQPLPRSAVPRILAISIAAMAAAAVLILLPGALK